MPTFDFLCHDCQERFSCFTAVADKDKTVCPRCGGKNLKQVFSAVNFSAGNKERASSSKNCAGRSCSTCSGC